MEEQLVLFDPRFIASYAGEQLLKDPITALVELIANAWDAGATEVEIRWTDGEDKEPFLLRDNGHGMTGAQLERRWRTLAYNRIADEGELVTFPSDVELPTRRAFGRNGVGRYAAFYFGEKYQVRTWRDGKLVEYAVAKGVSVPLLLDKIDECEAEGHGTEIIVPNPKPRRFTLSGLKSEIGMRFLVDPSFRVTIDGEHITFNDLPSEHVTDIVLEVTEAGSIHIIVIDMKKADATMNHHGVAWHVNGRLVGECSWKGSGQEALLDGRRIEAKRYTFVVIADGLADSVLPDWSGFDVNDSAYLHAKEDVQEKIRSVLLEFTKETRQETSDVIKRANQKAIASLTPRSRERWLTFVEQAQLDCPSVGKRDLVRLGGILAKLENAKSKYGLIEKLSTYDSDQMDDLHQLLSDWTVDTAKVVLDELKGRLKLIQVLAMKTADPNTDEVQELQPLFHRGLWIFGPEYETIEFTSNEGMTTVIQRLFESEETGSRNRPDFAITPDGTVGLYSYPLYDDDGTEIGVDRLTIVELKKPGVRIGTDQKNQCWKYVKELYDKGVLTSQSKVTCFALGVNIDPTETDKRTEKDGAVVIRPLRYSTVLDRAKSRTLKLFDRVKSAPFLNEDDIDAYLGESCVGGDMVEMAEANQEAAAGALN